MYIANKPGAKASTGAAGCPRQASQAIANTAGRDDGKGCEVAAPNLVEP